MKRKAVIGLAVSLLSLAVLVAVHLAMGAPNADATLQLFAEYSVPGSPLYVAVESPGHIWFTLPDQNAIGRLTVTSTVEYQVITYTVPTGNSQPYDIDYAGQAVWFTEQEGNKIGRLDTSTGTISEFPVPTLHSQPAGIDVLPGSPPQVWFTERAANKLANLVITSTTDYVFTEYSLDSEDSDARPEGICIHGNNSIWFTAPGIGKIGRLNPSLYPPFILRSTGEGSRPWRITVDHEGYPWFTDIDGNRVGKFFPQTIAPYLWYALPMADSDPFDIIVAGSTIWFTENRGNRIGQLVPPLIREFGLPGNSLPTGLSMDPSTGCVWVALSGRNRIASWCPPYFNFTYLPLVKGEKQ